MTRSLTQFSIDLCMCWVVIHVFFSLFDHPTTASSFLKTGLLPYTDYQFRIVAMNAYGETVSAWSSITTKQDGKHHNLQIMTFSGSLGVCILLIITMLIYPIAFDGSVYLLRARQHWPSYGSTRHSSQLDADVDRPGPAEWRHHAV